MNEQTPEMKKITELIEGFSPQKQEIVATYQVISQKLVRHLAINVIKNRSTAGAEQALSYIDSLTAQVLEAVMIKMKGIDVPQLAVFLGGAIGSAIANMVRNNPEIGKKLSLTEDMFDNLGDLIGVTAHITAFNGIQNEPALVRPVKGRVH